MKKVLNLVLAFTIATFFVACKKDVYMTKKMKLNVTGLEPLGEHFVYEGWLTVDGKPVSTGKFSSVTFPQTFSVESSNLENASKFTLTIEPAKNSGSKPSKTKILEGTFSGNSAAITSKEVVGDFSTATGKFFLATPTDNDTNNETSGIWWIDPSSGTNVAGLTLPTLSAGWKYEGWVIIGGKPVNTGKFTDPGVADENAANAPYKGADSNGPAFPGEDFIANGSVNGIATPVELKGVKTVISVEPNPDNSKAPFLFKILAADIPADAMLAPTTYPMDAGSTLSLSGTVTR